MRPSLLLLLSAAPLAAAPQAPHVQYATYLGGSLADKASAIAVDRDHNAYIAGLTSSPDFPLTTTAFAIPSADRPCAFVAKLNPTGTAILWSLCLPATTPNRIAVDSTGSVYLLTTSGANISSITRLSPAGDAIVYATSLGASAAALAVDAAGNAYAAGTADQDFAPTPGAYQTKLTPGTCSVAPTTSFPCPDAFATKLRPNGAVAYATFLGGSGFDRGRAIAVDSHENAWIAGDTTSPDFPGAATSKFHGEISLGPDHFGDAFVARLDPTGAALSYSTYLGGAGADTAHALVVDSSDAVYVAGSTHSPDFPVTPGAFQPTYGGGSPFPAFSGGDAFVTKFSSTGTILYSTFLGGPRDESATTIAVNALGEAYIDASLSLAPLPSTLSVLNVQGSAVLHSLSFGGSFAVDSSGSVYSAGSSAASLFFPAAGALQSAYGGGPSDATIAKTDFTGAPSPSIAAILNAANFRSGAPAINNVLNLAPGELVTIFGSGFGAQPRLSFDGIPASILYTQDSQINAVVPLQISGPTTSVTLQASGQTLGPAVIDVVPAAPAIFTLNATGSGPAAVLNQDGSINSPQNPALRGSTISVFITGPGRMTPPLPISTGMGEVLSSGPAPGLVDGVVQINIRLSQSLPPGDSVPIDISVGSYSSTLTGPGPTIAIR